MKIYSAPAYEKFLKQCLSFVCILFTVIGNMSCQVNNCEFVKDSLSKNILAGFVLRDENNMKSIVIRESKEEAGTWEVTEVVYLDGQTAPLNKHVRNLTSRQFNAIIDCACLHLKEKKMVQHSGILGDANISKLYVEYQIEKEDRYICHQVDFSKERDIAAFKQMCDLIYSIQE